MRATAQGSPSANGGPPRAASAGDARSIAALFLAAKCFEALGLQLEDGELQTAVETLIELSTGVPAPRNYDEVASAAIEALAEAGRRKHPTIVIDAEPEETP